MSAEAIGAIATGAGQAIGSIFGGGGFLDQIFFTKQDREQRNLAAAEIAANQTAANAAYLNAQAALVSASQPVNYGKIVAVIVGSFVLIAGGIVLFRWITKGSG